MRRFPPSRIRSLTVFLVLTISSSALAQPLRFRVKLAPELGKEPASGRLLVFLSSQKKPAEELSPGFGEGAHETWIAAKEIRNLAPGATVEVDPDELAYPAPLSTAPAGDYQAMALLDVNHDYAYAGDSSGDLRSHVSILKQFTPAGGNIELTLDVRVPEPKINPPADVHRLDFTSPSLSAFWGRPIAMRGFVLLPPSYEKEPKRKFPTVYWTHGFGARLHDLTYYVANYHKAMAEGKMPEMIYVLLDESCPGGTHEFADSVNNGPWGHALTKELIPHLEAKYRMDAKPSGRLLTGHSSGGWAVLWLQVTYPEIFGGSWPTAPDPSDFRIFTGPDLHSSPPSNFYRKPDGSPWMLVRMGGKDVQTLEDLSKQERVLGEHGGQMASFEWVFSPRGEDGRPMPLFDRDTGVVDPAVAKAWERYDISQILRKNADRLRPLLKGKIHLIVGTEDTFHLDEPARLLEQTAKELNIDIRFTFVPGKNHMNLHEGGLNEQIAKEMEEVARPKAKAAAK